MFFVLCGDSFINLTPFKSVAVVFFITHIFLTLFYLHKAPIKQADFKTILPIFFIGAVWVALIGHYISNYMLLAIMAVYITALSIMLWRAICIPKTDADYIKIVLGSLLFYVTDIAVLAGLATEMRVFVLITWAVYPPALFFLSMINVIKGNEVG